MRIDAHQHFWKYSREEYPWIGAGMERLARDYLPVDLEAPAAAAGIGGTVAVQARQTLEETQALLAIANAHPSVVRGVVGWLDLRLPLPDLRRQFDACLGGVGGTRLVGARHVIHDEEDDAFCVQPAFVAGVDLLAEYKLTDGASKADLAAALRELLVAGSVLKVQVGRNDRREPVFGLSASKQ